MGTDKPSNKTQAGYTDEKETINKVTDDSTPQDVDSNTVDESSGKTQAG